MNLSKFEHEHEHESHRNGGDPNVTPDTWHFIICIIRGHA
jgi:hypothetical protein